MVPSWWESHLSAKYRCFNSSSIDHQTLMKRTKVPWVLLGFFSTGLYGCYGDALPSAS